VFSSIAVDERRRIVERVAEGRRIAKAKGKSLGRPHTLAPEQRQDALDGLAGGESARSIASRYRVHHSTITRLKIDVLPVQRSAPSINSAPTKL